MENPLPILTSEQHCSLFALCTRSLSREFDMLKPQNISSKIFWVQLCKYSAPYVQGQETLGYPLHNTQWDIPFLNHVLRFTSQGHLKRHLPRRSQMKETLALMTYILVVELGPQHSPSHLACYGLGSEHQRCDRLPNHGSWFLPRKGMFLSAVPSPHRQAHKHTHSHTQSHTNTLLHTQTGTHTMSLKEVRAPSAEITV